MALAAFLVRGGFALIIVPVILLPTTAAVMTAVAPTLEVLYLGRPSLEGALLALAVVVAVVTALAGAGLAGSWLDLALVREASVDDELETRMGPIRGSAWQALAIRLAAHIPTLLALGYALARITAVAYEELTAPGDTGGTSVVERVLGRVPDAVLAVVGTWLVCETAGSLAARHAATGKRARSAYAASIRLLARPRGVATLALTSTVVVAVLVPFLLAAGMAWEHLRGYLLGGADAVPLAAALLLLAATWVLGLAIVGVALAWRATAWTIEALPD